MPIPITDAGFSTVMIIIAFVLSLIFWYRKNTNTEQVILSQAATQELKWLSILAIIFAHIGYVLVSDSHFLYPLSTFAWVGVDIFLFTSGYGLTLSMMRHPLSIRDFYWRRLVKICIPFWFVLCCIIFTDILFLGRHYDISYLIQSFFGWFPSADVWEDINSPFWYMTWILGFYIVFPIFFYAKKEWLTAIILSIIANLVTWLNPMDIQSIWLHQLHTNAFSLWILFAWFLSKKSTRIDTLLKFIKIWNIRWKYIIFSLLIAFVLFITTRIDILNWSFIGNYITQIWWNTPVIMTQILSLLVLSIIVILFIFKTTQNRFLALFGIYSYELYLIHWPLLSRYDIFFHRFPAWIATILWLIVLLLISYWLQKILKKIL